MTDDKTPNPDELPGDRRTDGRGADGLSEQAQAMGDMLDGGAPDVLRQDQADEHTMAMLVANAESAEAERSDDLADEAAKADADREALVRQVLPTSGSGLGTGLKILAATVLAVTGVAVAVLLFGGSDSTVVDTGGDIGLADDLAGSLADDLAPDPSGSSSDPASAAGGECASPAGGETTLNFSSRELAGGIPPRYERGNAYDLGFPTPSFEWSGAAPNATQLVIAMYKDRTSAGVDLDASDLWSSEGEAGKLSPFWIVSNIDPASGLLPNSSTSGGLPDGAIEQDHNSTTVRIDEVSHSNKFVLTARPGDEFVFAAFALCDPPIGARNAWSAGWLVRYAAQIDWFIATYNG